MSDQSPEFAPLVLQEKSSLLSFQNIQEILTCARSAGFHPKSREQVLDSNELTTKPIPIGNPDNPSYITYYSNDPSQLYSLAEKTIQAGEICGVITDRLTENHHWRRTIDIIVTNESPPKTYLVTNIDYKPQNTSDLPPPGYSYTRAQEVMPTGEYRDITMRITMLDRYEIETQEVITHSRGAEYEVENGTTTWEEIITQETEKALKTTHVTIKDLQQGDKSWIEMKMGYGSLDVPPQKIPIKGGEIVLEMGYANNKELLKKYLPIPELFTEPHTVTADQIRDMLTHKITDLKNAVVLATPPKQ